MSVALRDKTMDQYRGLMSNIRARFEIIDRLGLNDDSDYPALETAAFHLRKSIEGVAFACIVAMENGLRQVPRFAVGQWNADRIFSKIAKAKRPVFPSAINQEASGAEGVDHHIVANVDDALSIDEVRKIYRRTHRWLHEMNPYTPLTISKFDELRTNLIDDIRKTWRWLLHHMIYAEGEVFVVVLKNDNGQVECAAATANFENRQ